MIPSKNHAPFISQQVIEGQYYFLDLNPDPRRPVTVVCGGCEHCSPQYAIDRADFQYYSIEYVSSGKGEITLQGNAYPIQAGSIFCYGPEIPHCINSSPETPLVKYFVDFVGTRAVELLSTNPLFKLEPLYVSDPIRIFEIYENLQHTGASNTPYAQRICTVLLELLILRIAERTVSYQAATSSAWETYQQCRQFIESHFLEVHSAGEIASACHLDPAYLSRLFKRFSQERPYQLLLRYKMQRAAELLVHSGMLIKQVAQSIGFADPHHFSRVFKKHYQLSPAAFIKRDHRQRAGAEAAQR
jgi:AraC-like DNA-binding protein